MTISNISGMDDKKDHLVCSASKSEDMSKLYTEEEKTLINLVFEKILKIIVILTDADQPIKKITHWGTSIKQIDLSKIQLIIDKDYSGVISTFDKGKEFSRPKDIRFFYGIDGFIANEIKPIDYLHRIQTNFQCSASCYVIALKYIERFIDKIFNDAPDKKSGSSIFNQFSWYRIFLAAIVVAVKCFDDKYYSNEFYARVGGVGKKELWIIEHQFLMFMKLDLNVSLEEYNAAATENLETFIARKKRELEIKNSIEEQKKTRQTRCNSRAVGIHDVNKTNRILR